ncbi:hypothetical protein OJ998_27600 [Solirubrobacter taibaiensis]|nr:hypothetical protein [Solirubrobacter taibaiensis]
MKLVETPHERKARDAAKSPDQGARSVPDTIYAERSGHDLRGRGGGSIS